MVGNKQKIESNISRPRELQVEGAKRIRVVRKTPLGLWITTSRGRGKKELDLEHRWAAPLRKTISEGKPNGTWLYVALDDPTGEPRMLGSFVRTAGNRTLFRPGFDNLILPIDIDANDEAMVVVDHLSLDPRKTKNGKHQWSSHVATLDEKRDDPRGLNQTSPEQAGWMFPWFSLIIPSYESLEVLPREIFIPHEAPSSDLPDRPKRTLGEYKKPIYLKAVEVPPDGSQFFIQFDVWIAQEVKASSLKSQTFNYIAGNEDKRGSQKTLAGQTEFDLIQNEFWIRVMVSIRPGIAERPCILRPKLEDGEAMLI